MALAVGLVAGTAAQQEKPVPKDSMRISIPGCAKGVMFTGPWHSLGNWKKKIRSCTLSGKSRYNRFSFR